MRDSRSVAHISADAAAPIYTTRRAGGSRVRTKASVAREMSWVYLISKQPHAQVVAGAASAQWRIAQWLAPSRHRWKAITRRCPIAEKPSSVRLRGAVRLHGIAGENF